MTTSNQPVIVLPGGIWQAELVRFYQGKGHPVYVVNPTSTPATMMSNGHLKCDIKDLESVYSSILNSIRNPYIIASDQSDIACVAVSYLNRRFGLKHNSVEAVSAFSSRKGMMYSLAERLNIPVARYAECREIGQVYEFFDLMGSSKIIVKPDDGTNSRGFRVIQAHDDIKDAYAHARKFSENRTVIAQKYIEADEQITVEGFCQNGKHITLIASSKGQYWNPSLTSSLRWPAQGVSDSLMKKVFAANDKFVHNTNLTFGITHAEYMLNSQNGEFWLNEIACRGGGFRIGREIIKLATGFDTYEQMYGIQTDKKLPLELPKTPPRGVILQFYSTQDMESVSPWKLSQVQKIPGVFDFNYNFNRQSFMSDPSNIRHTYGIFEANTLDEAESVLYRVNDTMRGN